jgi:iron complex outermembrane receptor protein
VVAAAPAAPRYCHSAAGAQYRYSEEAPQKRDVSGRQFCLNLKYKF